MLPPAASRPKRSASRRSRCCCALPLDVSFASSRGTRAAPLPPSPTTPPASLQGLAGRSSPGIACRTSS
eukprot:6194337-Pleurochrysis_carterae.AAC.2